VRSEEERRWLAEAVEQHMMVDVVSYLFALVCGHNVLHDSKCCPPVRGTTDHQRCITMVPPWNPRVLDVNGSMGLHLCTMFHHSCDSMIIRVTLICVICVVGSLGISYLGLVASACNKFMVIAVLHT
jgi:hypothetical protein